MRTSFVEVSRILNLPSADILSLLLTSTRLSCGLSEALVSDDAALFSVLEGTFSVLHSDLELSTFDKTPDVSVFTGSSNPYEAPIAKVASLPLKQK